MRVSMVAASALVLVSAGCSGPQFIGRPDLEVARGEALPPPSQSDVAFAARPQILGPFDQVSVEVFNIPELSRTVTIDSSGNVALPLVGAVKAAGKTPLELAAIVEATLRSGHVRDPEVTVNVVQVVSQVVTVDGEVGQPGQYPVVGDMTLMRAVASAQGVTEFARQNYVVVFRTVGEQDMAALYDLRAIRQGLYEDPEIYANDIVFVGESRARRIFKDVIQSAGLITTPLVAVLRR